MSAFLPGVGRDFRYTRGSHSSLDPLVFAALSAMSGPLSSLDAVLVREAHFNYGYCKIRHVKQFVRPKSSRRLALPKGSEGLASHTHEVDCDKDAQALWLLKVFFAPDKREPKRG